MSVNLPLMPDDLVIDLGVKPDQPYYEEIKKFLSAGFLLEMTARALMSVNTRNSGINQATISALEDYIEGLSQPLFALREEEMSNTIYSPD